MTLLLAVGANTITANEVSQRAFAQTYIGAQSAGDSIMCTIYFVSTNKDKLDKLPAEVDYLKYNYTWYEPYPNIPNCVRFQTTDKTEAIALYNELRKHTHVAFRNWID